MKKYYNTMSPDAASHILKDNLQDAMNDAREKVEEDGRTRYVVKILYKIEPAHVPVKVTKI